MVDFVNLLGSAAGLFSQFQAANITAGAAQAQANTIRVGGEIAAQGALLTASGYRTSADAVRKATIFNLGVEAVNTHRRLQDTSRQYQRLLGRQLTQQASTGLSIGSKSFLIQRNEALDAYSTTLINMKVDAENNKRAAMFQSEVQQVNLENQARAADYQAAAERVMAANRAAEAEYQGSIARFKSVSSAISAAPTLLSQIFS